MRSRLDFKIGEICLSRFYTDLNSMLGIYSIFICLPKPQNHCTLLSCTHTKDRHCLVDYLNFIYYFIFWAHEQVIDKLQNCIHFSRNITYCKPTFICVREIFHRFARASSLQIFLAGNQFSVVSGISFLRQSTSWSWKFVAVCKPVYILQIAKLSHCE